MPDTSRSRWTWCATPTIGAATPAVEVDDGALGGSSSQRGFGDLTPRLKWNLWGNDGGSTALAAMPFVKLPTNQDELGNDAVEGGLILPLAASLPRGWSLGAMAEFDVIEDGDADGYHAEFFDTIALGHAIVGDLAGFVEFASLASAERDGDWVGLLGPGLTYAVSEDLQLDAGVHAGVSRAADDVSTFVGLSWRY
jgi:hypothetical protein